MLRIEPHERGAEGDDGGVALHEFVVASGDTSKLLEAAEKALDEVAVPIGCPIVASGMAAVATRWNDRGGIALADEIHQFIRVVSLVGHHGVGARSHQQSLCLRD